MNHIIVITGKSASGKDTIAKKLIKYGYKNIVSTTTRPMRSSEKQNIDYHFISDNNFQRLINQNILIEYRYYNVIENGINKKWHYGITKDEINLEKYSYVCVVDLKGLKDLEKEYGKNRIISFYIDVSKHTRMIRAMARDKDFEEGEFNRRCKDDDIKFKNVKYKVDAIVKNNNLDECISSIIFKINHIKKLRRFYNQYASF